MRWSATAIVLFLYRAVPLTGEGATWWMIDVLKFDESFLAQLSLLTYVLTLIGMFALRGFMARNSIATIVVVLSVAAALLALPSIGMFYGLHEWTAARTGGVVDARVITLFNTALESPLGQIAMIPMLAWIANSAPAHLKATYFAVMASFSNLALAASQLGTVYLNRAFEVKRGDYSELGRADDRRSRSSLCLCRWWRWPACDCYACEPPEPRRRKSLQPKRRP